MKTVEIPENWTGQEALLVYAFLGDVMEAIWACHEDQMVEILRYEENDPTDQINWLEPDDGFDEIPF